MADQRLVDLGRGGYTFSDLSPDPTNESPALIDEFAVFNEIESFLKTSPGDRLFRPDVGGDPHRWLFELAVDSIHEFRIFETIASSVRTQMPRVKLDYTKSWVKAVPANHQFDIQLAFEIIGLDDDLFYYQGYLLGDQ